MVRLYIRYVARAPETGEPHEVRGVDQRTGRSCWALTFERGVEVLWSPSGGAFVVTEWLGGDVADLIVVVPTSAPRHRRR